jgi:AcrR family transcriptional regulator
MTDGVHSAGLVTLERGQTPRKQADRSAATREQVIKAAIEVLYRKGYAGATTTAIAAAAGVSIGALQHQFATKALLMAAVARRFAVLRFLRYREALRGIPRGIARFDALNEASWSLIGTPEMAASTEIELALRNDPELTAAVQSIFDRHGAFIRRFVRTILGDRADLAEEKLESLRLLNSAVMLGMTVLMIKGESRSEVSRALGDWRGLLMRHVSLDASQT